MKHICVIINFEEEYKKKLEAVAKDCEITYHPTETDFLKTNIILGNPPVRLLDKMKNLEWIQASSAGTEAYTHAVPKHVLFTNMTGAFGLAISEHMVAAVTMLCKKLHLYRDNQLKREWLDRGTVKQIEGSTVLVIGMGNIGGNFAKRMKGLGCYIIGVRRAGLDKPDYADEVYTVARLDNLLPRADIIGVALPGTSETAGLLSRERINKIKNGAVIVNVGRGSAIDTEALCDALESKQLWGAALDVTDPEPLPPSHKLWRIENALITPHISGFYHLRKTYENSVEICIENTRRFLSGEPLMSVVDFETGYRKL